MNHTQTQESFPSFGLSLLFKIVVASTILYPAYSVEANNASYIRLVLPNILIVIMLSWYLLFCPKQYKAGKAAHIFCTVCIATLAIYNAACYYFNGLYAQWYWDQVNYTISILFFFIYGYVRIRAGAAEDGASALYLFRHGPLHALLFFYVP